MKIQDKLKYLKDRWGYVVIGVDRDIDTFHCDGIPHAAIVGESCYCRNYDIDKTGSILRNGQPFWGEQKGLVFPNGKIKQLVNKCFKLEKQKERESVRLRRKS